MARVNITVPDDVLRRARDAGLNVSRLAAAALSEELDRRARIAALDTYLRELEGEQGPVRPDERAASQEWADRLLSDPGRSSTARAAGTA